MHLPYTKVLPIVTEWWRFRKAGVEAGRVPFQVLGALAHYRRSSLLQYRRYQILSDEQGWLADTLDARLSPDNGGAAGMDDHMLRQRYSLSAPARTSQVAAPPPSDAPEHAVAQNSAPSDVQMHDGGPAGDATAPQTLIGAPHPPGSLETWRRAQPLSGPLSTWLSLARALWNTPCTSSRVPAHEVALAVEIAETCIDPYCLLPRDARAKLASTLRPRYSPFAVGSWVGGIQLTLSALDGAMACVTAEYGRLQTQMAALEYVANIVCDPGWSSTADGFQGQAKRFDFSYLLAANGDRVHKQIADPCVGVLRKLLDIRETTAGWRSKRRDTGAAAWRRRQPAAAAPATPPVAFDSAAASADSGDDGSSDLDDDGSSIASALSVHDDEPVIAE